MIVTLHHLDCLYDNSTSTMLALRNPAWTSQTSDGGLAQPREIMIKGHNGHQIFHHHMRHYDVPGYQSKLLFDTYVSNDVRALRSYRLELYVHMDQLNKRWKELRDAKSDRHIDSSLVGSIANPDGLITSALNVTTANIFTQTHGSQ